MSITGTIAAVAGIGSSIAGGIMQGNAAQSAAQAQKTAAQQAQQLELQNQTNAVNFQSQEWTGQQAAEAPYQALGQTSANAYANLLKNPFTAPTLAQAQQTPGYQFNLQTGTQAINENAAATGNLMSGNTGRALTQFGQGLATTTYQQAYQNALQQYMTNLNAAGQGVNTGLTSTAQLGQFGQATANNLANIYLTGGQQQASQLNNQGAAIAAGDVGQANAYSNMLNGVTNSVTQGALLNGIYNNGGLTNNGGFGGGFGFPNSSGLTGDPYIDVPGGGGPPNPYASIMPMAAYNPVAIPGAGSLSPNELGF
jgi:hypothetical protein